MKLISKQRSASILGLTLDGNRLEAVVLRRSGSSLQVKGTSVASLVLSPLGGDPALVGREIRNHLDQAGLREKRCVVCIPASWVLTMQTQLPELAEADVASFLELEAERGFTSGHEHLFIKSSRAKTAGGEQYATLIAVQRNHLDTLEQVLRAAQLKPVSFVLGLAALDDGGREGAAGALTVALGSNSVELGGVSGGGIVALRSLDGAVDAAGPQKQVDADLVAREIRITLGQLPAGISEGMRTVRVFARGELARQFVGDFAPRAQAMGLRVEAMDRASGAEFGSTLPPEIALSPALAAAANYVRAIESGPELMPPKINPFQAWMAKRAVTKKLGWAGLSAAAVVLIVVGLFVWQQIEISSWSGQKAKLDRSSKGVRDAQAQINKYNAWFDESFPALNVMKTMSESFPQSGAVTAKTFRVSSLTDVACSGVARDSGSLYRMMDLLNKAKGVRSGTVQLPQSSGSPPTIQFTLNFQWEGDINGE